MDAGVVGHAGVLGVSVVIINITSVSVNKKRQEQEFATTQSQVTVEDIVLDQATGILQGLARLEVNTTSIVICAKHTFTNEFNVIVILAIRFF